MDAPVYRIDPEAMEDKIAYPNLLFDKVMRVGCMISYSTAVAEVFPLNGRKPDLMYPKLAHQVDGVR